MVFLDVLEVVPAEGDLRPPEGLVRSDHEVEASALHGGDARAGVLQTGGPGLAERAVLAVGVLDLGRGVLSGVEVCVAVGHFQVDVDVAAVADAGHQPRRLVAFGRAQDFAICKTKEM